MNGARAGAGPRRGSSFGPGPRRGTDPEGGERSAWKGLCGPSGLNLDHSRIPDIQKMVYEHLVPLVVSASDPIPLSQFTSKCCDVLLPLLPRQQELGAHEFKSQWGRLNEFVCPELARRAGIADSGYSREHKTVCIDIKVGSGTSSSSGGGGDAGAAKPAAVAAAPGLHAKHAAAAPAAAAVAVPHPSQAPAAAAVQTPGPGTLSVPFQLAMPAGAARPAPGVPLAAVAPAPPPCAYCHGLHSMKHCADFHAMLQSIYQAGYHQGMAAAQQQQQQAAVPAQAVALLQPPMPMPMPVPLPAPVPVPVNYTPPPGDGS